ncbi:hypothetical protein J3A83DRAFT_4156216 [Scleroderma citrinum]
MADEATSTTNGPSRGRGRGKSRGGLGKYLRARGRGRGYGRPAEFTKRLVLEGEEGVDLDPEEAEELRQKYGRRQLGSNADRYVEAEPELGSDGEEIKEPEVDLSAFLERQRISEPATFSTAPQEAEDDDIDHDLDRITSGRQAHTRPKKGNVQTIAWDKELEDMKREKDATEAARDLKERFRAKADKLRETPKLSKPRKQGRFTAPRWYYSRVESYCATCTDNVIFAPPLPGKQVQMAPKEEMQDFLDELLN